MESIGSRIGITAVFICKFAEEYRKPAVICRLDIAPAQVNTFGYGHADSEHIILMVRYIVFIRRVEPKLAPNVNLQRRVIHLYGELGLCALTVSGRRIVTACARPAANAGKAAQAISISARINASFLFM